MDMKKLWPKVRRLEDAAEAGGMGRTTAKPPITYDGTRADERVFFLESTYVKVSDDILDFTDLKSLTANKSNGFSVVFDKADIQVMDASEGTNVVYLALVKDADIVLETPYCISCDFSVDAGDGEVLSMHGTYALDAEIFDDQGIDRGGYVSRIEFEETIHPIDPKFLPEMGGGTLGEEVWGDYVATALSTAINNAATGGGQGTATGQAPYHESLGEDINEIRLTIAKAEKVRFKFNNQITCEAAMAKAVTPVGDVDYATQISFSACVANSGYYFNCVVNVSLVRTAGMEIFVQATMYSA